MRTAFVNTLLAVAMEDPSVHLLTGDLGLTVFERFRDALPKQFLNGGVAEQNLIGVATGLAMTGKRVFVYSIVPFITFRCLEHIRNDLAYHNLPVCVVGVGGGYSYGHMGSTHHALEDIAVLRSIANMAVVCPADPVETTEAVRAIARRDGPTYLRLGKAGEAVLHDPTTIRFSIGRAIEVRPGSDVSLLSTGTMLETAMRAADLLEKDGVSTRVTSVHTIKPIDTPAIRSAAATKLIVTIEEHSRVGGLGAAVAECLAPMRVRPPHVILAAPDSFADTVGSQAFFRERAGLMPNTVAASIHSALPA